MKIAKLPCTTIIVDMTSFNSYDIQNLILLAYCMDLNFGMFG